MGEHFGVIVRAAEGLDPSSGTPVPLSPGCARNLRVGDIAKQDVPEAVLRLAGHRRTPRLLYELLSLQADEPAPHLAVRDVTNRLHCAGPEDLPDHGRILKDRLVG